MTTREVIDVLFGKPLASGGGEHRERVGPLAGTAILGLDALASAAYGPEALLTALMALGGAAPRYMGGLTVLIVALLFVLYVSYRQTITAYPSGGGAYTVVRENLGTSASLIAAAALSLDYLLNVAVAISAGVGAVVSALPALLPYTLPLCLVVLALITVINLRGFRATGAAFLLPTYLFIVCMVAVVAVGAYDLVAHGPHPPPVVAPPHPQTATILVPSGWLLARAFANGCTAMTGIEAVSNGVPIFRAPPEVGAHRTMTIIIVMLGVLLLGIALSCGAYGITATPPAESGYQSVLSQLVHATIGRGAPYAVVMASICAVLALSANTSFADFPRVCRMVAADGFLPEAFLHRGRRLAFSHGILVLSAMSAALLVVFRGVTDRLIPLFAVGALSAFTMSQLGMVVHWHRLKGRGSRHALALNAVGAAGTTAALAVVMVAKFSEGAWLSLLLVVACVCLFRGVRHHYDVVERLTATARPLSSRPPRSPVAVVPIRRWNRLAHKALRFATDVSPDVTAVQVLTGEGPFEDLTSRWPELVAGCAKDGSPSPVRLVVLRSEYRELLRPLVEFVRDVAAKHPGAPVMVILPRLVEPRWRFYLMHNSAPSLLRALLMYRGGPQIVLVDLPWYLEDDERHALPR
jgi:amino acid transporter